MEKKPSKKRLSEFYNSYPNSRIRKKMDELGLKSNNLSDRMNEILTEDKKITAEAVRQWIGGYTRPDIARLVAIADVIHCSIDYLMGRDERPTFESQYISDLIGLSPGSINALEHIKDFGGDNHDNPLLISLNDLIQSEYFVRFLESFFSYNYAGERCYLTGTDLLTKANFGINADPNTLVIIPSDKKSIYFDAYIGSEFKQIVRDASMAKMQECLSEMRKGILAEIKTEED